MPISTTRLRNIEEAVLNLSRVLAMENLPNPTYIVFAPGDLQRVLDCIAPAGATSFSIETPGGKVSIL